MRNRAIRDLLDRGWTPAMVGVLFGLTDRRVRQIRAEARRRTASIRAAARHMESARGGCSDGT